MTITGTSKDDVLFGTDASEAIDGLNGNDLLFGGLGDDLLRGGAGDDRLAGGVGNNVLLGGDGSDTAYYAFSTLPVYASLAIGHGSVLSGGQALSTDYYSSIENITGGQANDKLWGNDANNVLTGLAGDDELTGVGGNDTLDGGAGKDVLVGGTGNDALLGGTGNDQLQGGAGADVVNGGDGTDTASYYSSSSAVTVDLQSMTLAGGDATGDTLIGIEGLAGSALADDTLSGDGGANFLQGVGGDDTLTGRGGNDTLRGDQGQDVMKGNWGNDLLQGGEGKDAMAGGGGADTFSFVQLMDSGTTAAGRDVISDFVSGEDRITLTFIDADASTVADDAYSFIGSAAFTGTAPELHYLHSGGNTIVELSDKSGAVVMQIQLNGSLTLAAADFLL